jgi:hypothetical protein
VESSPRSRCIKVQRGGFINVLRKIASGDFTQADINAVNEILARTRPHVEQSIDQLVKLAGLIREHIGIESSMRLEDILYGDAGKGSQTASSLARIERQGKSGLPAW